jgi:hypothetical protein
MVAGRADPVVLTQAEGNLVAATAGQVAMALRP